MPPYKRIALSQQAFEELRRITRAELGGSMSDDDIREMGTRLLQLFDILAAPVEEVGPSDIEVTSQEFKTLQYLHDSIYHKHRSPSIRDVCRVLGVSSSRSGFRMIERLRERGFVYRDGTGDLKLTERVRGCDVKFTPVK